MEKRTPISEVALAAWDKTTSTPEPSAELKVNFIRGFCDSLNFNLLDHEDNYNNYNPLSLYIVDMSSLKIRLSGKTLIGLLKIPTVTPGPFFVKEQCERFANTILKGLTKYQDVGGEHFSGKISFLIIDGEESYLNHVRVTLSNTRPLDVIVFLQDTCIREILISATPKRALLNKVMSQINMDSISPYQYVGPVSESMFFGRKKELKEICNAITNPDSANTANCSFAIIASRQKGKTSLLQRVYCESKKRLDSNLLVYIDCIGIRDSDTLAKEIIKLFEPGLAYRANINDLKYFLKGKAKNKRFVLFLDEVDDIVLSESTIGWGLFKVLRSAYNEGFLRVVMCGYKQLYKAIKDKKIPATYNFFTEIRLPLFEYEEAFRLVTEPMEIMGLKFQGNSKKKIVDHLFNQTAGDPSYLQFYCYKIIDWLSRKKKKGFTREKEITLNLVKQIEDQLEFKRYLEDTFLISTSDIEKFILYTALKLPNYEYSFPELHKKIKESGLNISQQRLDTEMTDLELAGLIVKESDYKIRFAYPALPKVLNQLNTDYRASQLLPELKRKFE